MNEPDKPYVLFTERFQQIYQYLGVFCSLYFLRENEGICTEELLEKIPCFQPENEEIVSFLKEQELLTQKQERLHLNTSLFFRMSVWDLLICVEPWMKSSPGNTQKAGSIGKQEYNAIKTFAQTYALSDSYVRDIW